MDNPVPVALRSRMLLREESGLVPPLLPITPDGTTYTMTQEAVWLDGEHFAVGRWDGTLGIFHFNRSVSAGPTVSFAVNSPACEGVQMITWLAPGFFASSNDGKSVALWQSAAQTWRDVHMCGMLTYESQLGVATSGAVVDDFLLVGHEKGYVSTWQDRTLVQVIDVRSERPANPWSMHHIRGIEHIPGTNTVITASEDGDLCIVTIPEGDVRERVRYNPRAERGINSIALRDGYLLVANCAIGREDKNLWLFKVDERLVLCDSANLVVNSAAAQVFNFCTIWGASQDGPCFFASTEEGMLWMGSLREERLCMKGYQEITRALGSAVAYRPGALVVAGYDLHEFTTGDRARANSDNPEDWSA